MKRIAILTTGEAPVATAMMETLNRGNRYRIGKVPGEIAADTADTIAKAVKEEGVDMLIIEDYPAGLPVDFPIAYMEIRQDETTEEAIARLMEECPEYGPERQWAETLGESFDERRITPPPMPRETESAPAPEPPAQPTYQQPAYQPYRETAQPQFTQPGAQSTPHEPMPETSLLWAILATIFCCFIPGIVAIVYSSMVSSRYYTGNIEGARKASRLAQIWIIVSIVLGCVTNALYVPMMLMGNL